MRPVISYTQLVVAILALAAAMVSVVNRGPVSDIARGVRIFPGLGERLQQAVRLELTRGDTRFTLLRGEKGWVLPDKGNYPARIDTIRQALSGLAELEIVEAKTAKPELFSRLNLTDVAAPQSKATAITVKDGDGATLAALLVGKKRVTAALSGNDASMIYVRKPSELQSWLAQGQLDLPADAVDWAERGLTDLAPDKILSVRLTDAEGQQVVLDKPDPDKSDFVLRDIPPGRDIKSQFELNGLAAALEGLNFEDVLPAADMTMPERSAKAEYTTRDGLSVTISLSARAGKIWAAIAASGAGENAMKQAQAIASKTTGWVYRLPDWKRQKMQTSLEALLKAKDPS